MPRPKNILRLALNCSTALVAVILVGEPLSAKAQDLQINSSYSVTDGQSLSFEDITISNNGPGLLQQSGGSLTSNYLFVGDGLNASPATYTMSGGSHQSGQIQVGSTGTGTLTQQAGSISASDGLFVGSWDGNGTYALQGGDVSSAYSVIGYEGTGTFVQTGGTHDAGTLYLGYLPLSSGTYHLDGGTLRTNGIVSGQGIGIFNFNGGTLAAADRNGDFVAGLSRLNIRNGGAIVDTSGFVVTIGQSLLHSDIGGDNAIDGGLTKKGAGTLTLLGANTYTGNTTVTGGLTSAPSVLRLSGAPAALGTMSSDLSVGGTSGDLAELHVIGGASLVSRNAVLGMDRNASGSVTVSGAGSSWTNAGLINVGMLGAGHIDIRSGGFVETQNAVLASHGTGHGTVSVSGPGSTWLSNGLVIVGENGGGSSGSQFTVASGGLALVEDLWIGGSATGSGTGRVAVSGASSTLLAAGDLHVGYAGNGGLTISDGGTVSVGLCCTGVLSVATLSGSAGTLSIGAQQGEAAAGAGTVDAAGIAFGAGTGRLILNHTATDYRLDAAITGNGSVNVYAGTTAMGGVNTYSGGTFIHGGVLEIASSANLGTGPVQIGGGNSGSATLRFAADTDFDRAVSLVSNSAVLDVVGGRDVTVSGAVSGLPGVSLTKTGAGTLRLTGANTYLGNTWLNAGALVGGAGSFGTGNGFITTAGGTALVLDQASNATFTHQIRGAGILVKTGAGTLTLTGENGHAGGTLIAEGGLTTAVDTGFGLGPLTIQAGGTATLTGSAALGALSVTNGGTLAFEGSATASTAAVVNTSGLISIGGLTAAGTSIGSLNGAGDVGLGARTLTLGSLNRNDTISGVIADAGLGGSLVKTGTGTLTLSGANTYTGATIVNAGSLTVNGSLASGATVNSGASLAGAGAIGGAVVIADGGHLVGTGGQTLTMGSLALGSGSIVDVTIGTSAPLAFFDVTGDLMLDGTLNVSDASGFGIGVTRLFDYGGTLTDNGLAIGATPAGSTPFDFSVQTAVAGQVNLVNGTGLTLNFWDGGNPSHLNNGAVDGGAGTWTANSETWTDIDGRVTMSMRPQPGFAVFQGTAGTVMVDDNAGAVTVAGMQFAVDGYAISGDALSLSAAQTVIRVGDGTAAGAGYTATIGSVLTGSGGLVKTDRGTLVLTGDNTYSGGTTIAGGTLRVASDANLGAASGGMTLDGGSLLYGAGFESARAITLAAGGGTFDTNGFDAALTGPVSGTGGLTKAGTGTLTLTGANTSTGGTVIAGGTLVASSASLGTGAIVNNAALVLEQAGDGTIAAPLSGTGTLTKTGAGTLTLSGDGSAFTGSTVIGQGGILLTGRLASAVDIASAGTLQVGDGVVAGDLTGAAANDGTLIFDQPGDYDYTGALSGVGALIKRGAGLLTLSGAYTYTGATVIEGGAIQLASSLDPTTELVLSGGTFALGGRSQTVAGLSGSGGTIAFGGGALTVNQNTDTTFAGSLTGTGAFIKRGSGRLDLTGFSPFGGGTFVRGGTLAVNGGLRNSTVTVQGGTLGGNGTVGGLIVQNSGVAAPGNSIGALTVAGNVRFEPGSVYQVEVNAAGQNDRIGATGAATLQGGTVQVLAGEESYAPLTRYTILTASAGVNGTFADVTSNLAFLDPLLTYTTNAVQLTMYRNDISFAGVALTDNQLATAGAVEGLAMGNSVYDAVLPLDAANARAAFDALSGEVHAAAAGTLVETSRFVREAVTDRLMQGNLPATVPAAFAADLAAAPAPTPVPLPPVLAPQWGFWGQGFGSWGQSDRTANSAKAERSTGGFLLGLDGGLGETGRLGFAGGYSSTSVDLDARASSATIHSYHAAIYGGTRFGNLALRLGGAYAWHDLETTRTVNFPGFSDVLRADYRARTSQAFGELGYSLSLGGASFEPFAGLAYVHVGTDRFREEGGAAALTGLGGDQDVTYSTLGVRMASTVAVSGTTALTARGMIGWRHAFDEVNPVSRLTFAAGTPFAVSGTPIAQDALVLDAELGMAIGADISLGLAYGGQLARDVQDHSVKGNVTLRF